MHTDKTIYAYVGSIPKNVQITPFACEKRNEEIEICASEKRKLERFCVWKLLEYALERTFGKKMKKLVFAKTYCGKWVCEGYEFSLSHSHGVVAVAVSRKPVGVDIELDHQMKEGIEKKILSDVEFAEFEGVDKDKQNDYLLTKWTQKESVFKTMNLPSYSIKDVKKESVKTFKIQESERDYYLSVTTPYLDNIKIVQNVQL